MWASVPRRYVLALVVTASLRGGKYYHRSRLTPAVPPPPAAAQNRNGTRGRDGKGEERGVAGKRGELSPDADSAQPANHAQFDQTAGQAGEASGQASAQPKASGPSHDRGPNSCVVTWQR